MGLRVLIIQSRAREPNLSANFRILRSIKLLILSTICIGWKKECLQSFSIPVFILPNRDSKGRSATHAALLDATCAYMDVIEWADETGTTVQAPADRSCTEIRLLSRMPWLSIKTTPMWTSCSVLLGWWAIGSISSHSRVTASFTDGINHLGRTPKHALLYSGPNDNGRAAREMQTESVFEKFEFPSFYLARSDVLNVSSRNNKIVSYIWYSGNLRWPMVEGSILSSPVRRWRSLTIESIVKDRQLRTVAGANTVRETMNRILIYRHVQLQPLYIFTSKIERSENGDMVLNREPSIVERPKVTKSFSGCSGDHLDEKITASIAKASDTTGRPA